MCNSLRFLSSMLLVVAGPSVFAQTPDMGPIVNQANGSTYYRLSASDWTAAEAAAVRLGGHLVTIDDGTEHNWVFSTFSQPGQYALWIGLNDAAQEGTWVWSSGAPYSYRNWAHDQPDNFYNEDYVMIMVQEWGVTTQRSQRWCDFRDDSREDEPGGRGGWLQGVVEVPCAQATKRSFTVFPGGARLDIISATSTQSALPIAGSLVRFEVTGVPVDPRGTVFVPLVLPVSLPYFGPIITSPSYYSLLSSSLLFIPFLGLSGSAASGSWISGPIYIPQSAAGLSLAANVLCFPQACVDPFTSIPNDPLEWILFLYNTMRSCSNARITNELFLTIGC